MGKWIWEELGEGKYDLVYCIKHLNERIKVKKKTNLCHSAPQKKVRDGL